VDGAADDVGIKDGGEEIVGGEDNVGRNEMDGTADGTPRVGSHSISILSVSKYVSQRTYRLGFSPVLKMDNL